MSYSSEVLADLPLIYLRLGEASGTTAVDASGNANDGTYNNAPALGVTGAVSGDTAVTFTAASSQDVRVGYSSPLNTTTLSLECWVKTTGANQAIMGRAGSSSAPICLFVDPSGHAQAVIKTSGTSGTSYSGSVVINDGVWHHVVITRDTAASNLLCIYVDGVLDFSTTGAAAPSSVTQGFAIASRGGSPYLNGTVDEAAYYTTALSSTRISAHYSAAGGASAASGTASLSLSASGGAGANGAGSATLSLSASGATSGAAGGSASLSLDATGGTQPPADAAGTASLSLSASGGASGSPAGSASLNLTATGAAFAVLAASGSATLTLTASGSAVMSASGSATLTLSAGGIALALFTTDTSNALDGLDLLLTMAVFLPVAVAAPPASLATKYDKALAYTTPTMAGGRPT